MKEQPNILIITPHDLGDYLPCYGTPVAAPNLDALAAGGVVMRNHFCTGSVCSPARGSIVTGCYPHTHGLMGLVHRGWALDVDRCPPLPAMLAREGYRTALFGIQHEHHDPAALGYQQASPGIYCEKVAADAAKWLLEQRGRPGPFLAAIGFFETHRRFDREVYKPADPAKVHVRPFLPDIPEVRKDLADFYGSIQHMDQAVGVVLGALDEAGLAQNTIVLFVTDHGASFIKSKATLYEGGTKVACIMRWPAGLPGGRQVEALTTHVDIVPTIFELLGLPTPPGVQGVSQAQVLLGRVVAAREYAFAEKNYTNYFDPTRMVRTSRYRNLRKGLQTCVLDFQIPEIEALTWNFRTNPTVFEFYSHRRCREELYDLQADPGERVNLVDDPLHAPVLAELRKALDRHMEATDDPFRHMRDLLPMPADGYERLSARRASAS
jgi:arylsulfatase A-like enzyme